ncbi:MAG: pyridoxamine 5'-phosphate oxidase [Actinomycetota bacterium]|nr:pyridoxamine 5'-phosphate oxidase [Actinomycetota bacterium]
MDLAALRREYQQRGLDLDDAAAEPFTQFERWFREIGAAGVIEEPNAVVVATAGPSGRPTARHVLAKAVDGRGLVFYTNYGSRKARDLDANPQASAVFAWSAIARQVTFTGPVEKVTAEESDAYFASRPRGSQLGAWASTQSRPVADRAELERAYADVEASFADGPVPRPDGWGGYRIVADEVEFWQGRPNRLHDRIVYVRADGGWRRQRLAP